jgi:sugar lactone lactonase YvrE
MERTRMLKQFVIVVPAILLGLAAPVRAQTISLYAGNAAPNVVDSLAIDASGNMFVSSPVGKGGAGGTVAKITPSGATTTVFTAPGTDQVSAVAIDGAGNLYVADVVNGEISRVTPGGTVSIFVDAAQGLSLPAGLAFDSAGNLYVSNQGTDSISKVTPAGVVSTFVDGSQGLARPRGLAFDANGNLYVANSGSVIFGPPQSIGGNRAFTVSLVTPGGVVNNFTPVSFSDSDPDFDPVFLTFDHSGNLFVSVAFGNLSTSFSPVYEVTPAGSVSRFDQTNFFAARGLATNAQGNIVVGDAATGTIDQMTEADAVTVLFRTDLAGTISTVFDASGNLYIANQGNDTITKVTPAGAVGTFVAAGQGLTKPQALAFDGQGNLYVANSGPPTGGAASEATISKVTPAGVVSTFLGPGGGLGSPQGLAVDAAGNLYIANQLVPSADILKVTPAGAVSTFVQSSAHLGVATGLAFDASGNLFVAGLTSIFEISPDGGVSTFATLPGTIISPQGLAFDASGNLYTVVSVFDPDFSVGIVEITPSGTQKVVAQNIAGATTPQLANPTSLAFDSTGRLYAADPGSNAILQIDFTPPPLVASILPGSRSVETSVTATVFATMINATAAPLDVCGVELPVTAKGTMTFQTTNPATNGLTGTPNQPVTLAANGVQSFVLAFQGDFAFTETNLAPIFFCQDVAPAATVPGVDTVDLTFSTSPIADIIALSATATNDGTVHLANDVGAFAVATIDAGAPASLTAVADTGGVTLPVSISLCQTSSNGQCLSPPAASVPITYAADATPTFSVFVSTSSPIPFSPAASRIFVRFEDSDGVSHGTTSVAVTTS